MISRVFHSPNFSERKDDAVIDTVVIHHTKMDGVESVIQRFLKKENIVSSHYLISKDGEIIKFVDEYKRAHHAGISHWRGREALNDYSIGIELDNLGDDPFPQQQMDSLLLLLKSIFSHHKIDNRNVVGHFDIAPDRKDDPNPLFNWKLLADNGYGVYTTLFENISEKKVDPADLQEKLTQFGYHINNESHTLSMAVNAFRQHYAPEVLHSDYLWDTLSEARIIDLLNSVLTI